MWRSRILFGLTFIGATLLVRYYEDSRIGFTLIYALLLLLVCSLAAVLAAPLCLKIEEQADRRELFKGESLRYTATVNNRGFFFYPNVRIDRFGDDWVDYGPGEAAMGPRGLLETDRTIEFPYRGVFDLGIRTISVTDFLGLFRVTFAVDNPQTVTVFPEGDERFAVFIRNDSQNASFRRDLYSESYADVADVRKYTPTDSYRKIHWKLSAKRAELMVKNYHSFDPSQTLLFLDTKRTDLEGAARRAFEDRIVSFATAGVAHALEARIPAWLVYGDGAAERAAVDAEEDPEPLYRLLAAIPFDREHSPLPAFCRSQSAAGAPVNLILFLSSVDAEIFDALTGSLSRDHHLFLYYFHAAGVPIPDETGACLDNLQANGVAVSRVEVPL